MLPYIAYMHPMGMVLGWRKKNPTILINRTTISDYLDSLTYYLEFVEL